MTDIYIISGFLGAGKTTLIKTMVRSAFKGREVVVVENDFGEAGIDAGLLRECSLTVTSLSAGCICCSLNGDFERAVEQILKDYAPAAIFVEPSGVGKLSDVIKSCLKLEDAGKLCLKKAITVIDIRSFDKYRENYGEFFEDQIAYADLILLSHQEESLYKIQTIEKKIQEINQEAKIEADFWDSIPVSVFRNGPRNSSIFKLELAEAVSMKPVRVRGGSHGRGEEKKGFFRRHFAGDVFSSVTLECNGVLSEAELRKRVRQVVEHGSGDILRGKGIVSDGVHGLIFHYLPGSLNIEPASIEGNQVCFIGTGLDEQQIRTLFGEGDTYENTCMDYNRSAGFGKDHTHQSAD